MAKLIFKILQFKYICIQFDIFIYFLISYLIRFLLQMSNKKNAKNNEPTEEEKIKAQLLQMKKNDSVGLKQDIFRLKEQLLDILKNKKQVEEQIQKTTNDNIDKTFQLENKLKRQEQRLIEIENKHNELFSKQKAEIQALTNKFILEQQANQAKKQREIKQKKEQLDRTSQQVKFLKKYPERKQKYLASIKQLNERLQRMKAQQDKDINNIKLHHMKQRQKQEKDTQTQMQRIKQSEINRLEQKMTTQQFIKKQNQIMEAEIALCQEQVEILSKECIQLRNQIQVQKNQTGQNALGSQANQTYERSLRIIKLEGKLSKLKAYLTEQTARLEKQYEELDNIYTKQEQQIEGKIAKVEGWMRIKQRDLKKVKACSQMVLNQRSNLESYLLEVFHEHPQIQYKQERNINKILRFLFAKINSKKPPMTYKHFLPESLKSISSSSFRA